MDELIKKGNSGAIDQKMQNFLFGNYKARNPKEARELYFQASATRGNPIAKIFLESNGDSSSSTIVSSSSGSSETVLIKGRER